MSPATVSLPSEESRYSGRLKMLLSRLSLNSLNFFCRLAEPPAPAPGTCACKPCVKAAWAPKKNNRNASRARRCRLVILVLEDRDDARRLGAGVARHLHLH